jgi:hypothetical protein
MTDVNIDVKIVEIDPSLAAAETCLVTARHSSISLDARAAVTPMRASGTFFGRRDWQRSSAHLLIASSVFHGPAPVHVILARAPRRIGVGPLL